MDTSGNVNFTAERTVAVIDTEPPELLEDITPSTATTGGTLAFTVTARDNVGLREARVRYTLGEGDPIVATMHLLEENASGEVVLNLTIELPPDIVGALVYVVELEDMDGNVLTSGPRTVQVVDDDAPVLVEDLTPPNALAGGELAFLVRVADNIGVEGVQVEYDVGGGAPTTAPMV
ncbi:MAG: hypothetical protein GWN18_12415, partial [Thermoplasmata archaeon]|nr:hypothetical protein [Thermoplasmata archaeon]NIS12855.1 hypothetical protein [Thermoplasmata archaeon]NIW83336.1 hypothetical protein [Thermoplasmata archaeon]NIW89577.1 hypothetical protein [Thermoplasmata archaeon]